MLKVRADKLKPGMVTAEDVYDPEAEGGLPLLNGGIALVEGYISRLRNHGVRFVFIELPEGYTGAPGETLELERIKKDVRFEGKLTIAGSISTGLNVVSRERLAITGDIEHDASVECTEGSIVIRGVADGANGAPARITAGNNIILERAALAEIKAGGDVKLTGSVMESTITAKGSVQIDGRAHSSRIVAQDAVRLESADTGQLGPLSITVKPLRLQEFLQELLRTDARLEHIRAEKQRLSNIIELIKKLGASIHSLPQEKRLAMAADVKQFKEFEVEEAKLARRKAEIMTENQKLVSAPWVFIHGNIAPGTRITIFNYSFEVGAETKHKMFSVRDFKIYMAEYKV